jgi:YgiT-type zinc finger domain-containing protein
MKDTIHWKETFVEQTVTYTLLKDGQFYLIENVPTRVCVETGEQFFSPPTVEKLQRTLWSKQKPVRMIQTPVFEFAR